MSKREKRILLIMGVVVLLVVLFAAGYFVVEMNKAYEEGRETAHRYSTALARQRERCEDWEELGIDYTNCMGYDTTD